MIASVGRMMRKGGGGHSWPAGMKEHIKAWYDPKKQGMTNFDVIESYTEDFTTWRYLDSRGIATITGSTIHITEAKSIQGIVEDNKEPYSDIKILVQGVTADNPLNVRDINGTKAVIDKDGVYEFKDNGLYFGFGFSKVGVVDVTITQLPTSILKDLSGNGNHAYLYGGKGKLNSGMGVYKFDFLSDLRINSAYIPYSDRQEDKICSLIEHPAGWLFQFVSLSDIPAFKVEVKGIVNDRFVYRYYDENGNRGKEIIINKDGIYELPISYSVENNTGVGIVCSDACVDNVCFTQIPDYPNQLCYDGKMYAVCYDFPILTDYTVMAERTWFENRNVFLAKGNITTEAKYAFIFERFKPDGVMAVQSFGAWNDVVSTTDSCISYLTKNKYNGIDIRSGIGADDDMLSIGGALNKGNIELTSVCCHGAIIVADRSFTEDEITWLKDNLFRK